MTDGSATTGPNDEPFTLDKLREAMEKCPQPVGWALLSGSALVDCCYRIQPPRDETVSLCIQKMGKREYRFMLVVPSHHLQTVVALTRATPSLDYPHLYEYQTYSLEKGAII